MSRIRMSECFAAIALAAAMTVGGLATSAQAQDQNQPSQAQGRRDQARQRADSADGRARFEEFRQRMAQRMKEQLGANDDEWKVLQPKIEKVTQLAMQSRGGGGFFGGRGRGGPGGAGAPATGTADNNSANQPAPSPTAAASRALRDALADENTSSDTIKRLLKEFRDARAKAQKELATAREDLRSVLTLKQEATLVTMGVLE
jgi:flagellar motility protein MotE (MotC chaperone)